MLMKQTVVLAQERAEVAQFRSVAKFAVHGGERVVISRRLAVAKLAAVVGDHNELGECDGVPTLLVNVGRSGLPQTQAAQFVLDRFE